MKLSVDKKNKLKTLFLIFLYGGAIVAFVIGIKINSHKKQEEQASPSATVSSSPKSTGIPEISIPPQPTFKPVIKSPSPSPKTSISPSPSSTGSASPSPEISPSPSPEVSPSLSPALPEVSPSPSSSPEVSPSPPATT